MDIHSKTNVLKGFKIILEFCILKETNLNPTHIKLLKKVLPSEKWLLHKPELFFVKERK